MLCIYGALRGAKLDAGRPVRVYIYIYKEDFAQQYDKCGAWSGSPQLFLHYVRRYYTTLYSVQYCTTYIAYYTALNIWYTVYLRPSLS